MLPHKNISFFAQFFSSFFFVRIFFCATLVWSKEMKKIIEFHVLEFVSWMILGGFAIARSFWRILMCHTHFVSIFIKKKSYVLFVEWSICLYTKNAVKNMIQSTMSYNNSKRKKMEMVVKWRKKEFSFIFSFGKLYCCCCCWCLYLRISFEFELMMMWLLLLLFAFSASLKRFRDIYFARNMNSPVQKIHIIYKNEGKMHTFHPYKYEEKNKQTNECHQHEQL